MDRHSSASMYIPSSHVLARLSSSSAARTAPQPAPRPAASMSPSTVTSSETKVPWKLPAVAAEAPPGTTALSSSSLPPPSHEDALTLLPTADFEYLFASLTWNVEVLQILLPHAACPIELPPNLDAESQGYEDNRKGSGSGDTNRVAEEAVVAPENPETNSCSTTMPLAPLEASAEHPPMPPPPLSWSAHLFRCCPCASRENKNSNNNKSMQHRLPRSQSDSAIARRLVPLPLSDGNAIAAAATAVDDAQFCINEVDFPSLKEFQQRVETAAASAHRRRSPLFSSATTHHEKLQQQQQLLVTSPSSSVAMSRQSRRPSREAAHLRRTQSGLQQLYLRWRNGRPYKGGSTGNAEVGMADMMDRQPSGIAGGLPSELNRSSIVAAAQPASSLSSPTAIGVAPSLSFSRLVSTSGSGWSTPRGSFDCRGKGRRGRHKATACMRRLRTTRIYMPSVVEGPKAASLYSAPTAEAQELLLMLLRRGPQLCTPAASGPPTITASAAALVSSPGETAGHQSFCPASLPEPQHLSDATPVPVRTATPPPLPSGTAVELPRWVRERPLTALYYQPWGLELLARYEAAHQPVSQSPSAAQEGAVEYQRSSRSTPSSESHGLSLKKVTWATLLRHSPYREVAGPAEDGASMHHAHPDPHVCHCYHPYKCQSPSIPAMQPPAATAALHGHWPHHLSAAEEHEEREELEYFKLSAEPSPVKASRRCNCTGERSRPRVWRTIFGSGSGGGGGGGTAVQPRPSRRRRRLGAFVHAMEDSAHTAEGKEVDEEEEWQSGSADVSHPSRSTAVAPQNEEEETRRMVTVGTPHLGDSADMATAEDEEHEVQEATAMSGAAAAMARSAQMPRTEAPGDGLPTPLAFSCEEEEAAAAKASAVAPAVDVIFFLQHFLRAALIVVIAQTRLQQKQQQYGAGEEAGEETEELWGGGREQQHAEAPTMSPHATTRPLSDVECRALTFVRQYFSAYRALIAKYVMRSNAEVLRRSAQRIWNYTSDSTSPQDPLFDYRTMWQQLHPSNVAVAYECAAAAFHGAATGGAASRLQQQQHPGGLYMSQDAEQPMTDVDDVEPLGTQQLYISGKDAAWQPLLMEVLQVSRVVQCYGDASTTVTGPAAATTALTPQQHLLRSLETFVAQPTLPVLKRKLSSSLGGIRGATTNEEANEVDCPSTAIPSPPQAVAGKREDPPLTSQQQDVISQLTEESDAYLCYLKAYITPYESGDDGDYGGDEDHLALRDAGRLAGTSVPGMHYSNSAPSICQLNGAKAHLSEARGLATKRRALRPLIWYLYAYMPGAAAPQPAAITPASSAMLLYVAQLPLSGRLLWRWVIPAEDTATYNLSVFFQPRLFSFMQGGRLPPCTTIGPGGANSLYLASMALRPATSSSSSSAGGGQRQHRSAAVQPPPSWLVARIMRDEDRRLARATGSTNATQLCRHPFLFQQQQQLASDVVLVHCSAGMHRSCGILIAFFLWLFYQCQRLSEYTSAGVATCRGAPSVFPLWSTALLWQRSLNDTSPAVSPLSPALTPAEATTSCAACVTSTILRRCIEHVKQQRPIAEPIQTVQFLLQCFANELQLM